MPSATVTKPSAMKPSATIQKPSAMKPSATIQKPSATVQKPSAKVTKPSATITKFSATIQKPLKLPQIPPRPTHKSLKIRVNMGHFRKLPDSVLADIAWFLIHKYRDSPLWSNEDLFIDFILRKLLAFEISSLYDASQSADEPVDVSGVVVSSPRIVDDVLVS
jgi:hypothetical protein